MKLLQISHKLLIGLFVLLMPIVSRAADFNPAVDPILIDGQSYYEILEIPANTTYDAVQERIGQKIMDVANRTKTLLAMTQNSQKRNQIKKETENQMRILRTIESLFDIRSAKHEYDRALAFYQSTSKRRIADMLSRPIVEYSNKATPSLKWKIELTNETDEYLYAVFFDHGSGKEIAPLSRSGGLLALTPKNSSESSVRINNIELPAELRLTIYDGSDRKEARPISTHFISVGSGQTVYLDIFNNGYTVLPKSSKGKTASGLSTSNNVFIGNITDLR